MAIRNPDFYPQRLSMYVPDMSYAADVIHNAPYRCEFGAPPTIATAYATVALTSGAASTFYPAVTLDHKWGVALTLAASAACTRTGYIRGRDYLNQKIKKTFTVNGTTAVAIDTGFKYIDEINLAASADTVTVTFTTTKKLGLPYKAQALLASLEDGITATAGSLTAAVTTDPGTATSGDPRGLFSPNGTLDGTKTIAAVFLLDTSELHGVAHYYA